MTELDASAREVLRAARSAYEPTPDDQKRVRAALVPALAGAPEPSLADMSPSSPAATTAAGDLTVAKLVAGGVLIGAVGFGGGYAVGQNTAQEPPLPATLPSEPQTLGALATSAASVPTAPPRSTPRGIREDSLDHDPALRGSASRAKSRPVTSDKTPEGSSTLGEEVTLLRRAQRTLREGDPAGSLALLDWMKERYPSGALAEERTVARVLALCSAGKDAQARGVAGRFLAKHPGSVHAARLRSTCAFSRSDEPGE
jgi:hypothetical protein